MAERTPLQRVTLAFFRLPPVRAIWRRTLKTLFGLSIHGLEHLPSRRPLIFVGNHGSHYDGLFSRTIAFEILGAEPCLVAWGGVRDFPFARHAIAAGAFSLILTEEEETPESRAKVLDQIIAQLREGRSVVLHAEGERHDALGVFHPGAAYAALATGVPIVPFTLCGVQPLWKTLPWPDRWHGRVSIHFHRAVDPAKFAILSRRDAVEAMIAEVRLRVASALDYPDAFKTPRP